MTTSQPQPPQRRAASVVALAATLFGCSLTREKAQCESTQECKQAFGTGYVCASAGLCELADVEPACLTQTPGGLLLAPDEFPGHVVFGSLLRSIGKEGARQDSALLALDAVNNFLQSSSEKYPSLGGLQFGMVQCNHDGATDEVARLARYLSTDILVPAILGPASSVNTLAAFSSVNLDEDKELRRTVFMSPSATSVALSSQESARPGFLWRTAPTDDGQGRLMGEFAESEGLQYIAVYEETAYGRGLYDELSQQTDCGRCGFSFEASSTSLDGLAGVLSTDDAVAALQNADVVFFMGAQEAHLSEMIQRLDTPEFDGKALFFSDAGASADTISQVKAQDVDRVFGTRPRSASEGEALRVFSSVYEARHEESPLIHSFTTNTYDATWLLLLASLSALLSGEEVSAEAIARGLTRLSSQEWKDVPERDCPTKHEDNRCEPINLVANSLETAVEALQRFGEIDVRGASGPLDYDSKTEELLNSSDSFEFWHLEKADESGSELVIQSGPPNL